ncbi:HYDIN protein, partial [Dicaeum eximium]|nr:HYDIN protein [Dicaeum eximium]
LRLEDEHRAFFLKGRASTLKRFYTGDAEEDSIGNESKSPKKSFLLLCHGQSTKFDVIFKPPLAQRLEGKIHVLEGDTYSNMTLIELVGEGHKDEFTLEGLEKDTEERNAKSSLMKDIIDGKRGEAAKVEQRRGKCLIMCVLSQARPGLSPTGLGGCGHGSHACRAVGHLHPGCAKGITVTLKSDVPATFRRHPVKCKVTKINFELPQRNVQDWDDQMSVVTWKDTTRKDRGARWPKKEKV